jgi:hypothetical protein
MLKFMVYLVCSVYLVSSVYLVCLVYLVYLVFQVRRVKKFDWIFQSISPDY